MDGGTPAWAWPIMIFLYGSLAIIVVVVARFLIPALYQLMVDVRIGPMATLGTLTVLVVLGMGAYAVCTSQVLTGGDR